LVAAKRQKESIDVLMARQAAGHLRAAWARCARCFYYGRNATFGDAKGFPGLLAGYDATNRVVDAAGTSDNTCSSVWLVKFGPEETINTSLNLAIFKHQHGPRVSNLSESDLVAIAQEYPRYDGNPLNVLRDIGITATVIPHFDNAEGGNHDTRFCYLGESRLRMLETHLHADEFIIGVDEHTGLVIDLERDVADVVGNATVTLRKGDAGNGVALRLYEHRGHPPP
jgi:hypothetical protein